MSATPSLFSDARKRAEKVRQWADLNGGELEWLIDDEDLRGAFEEALWLAPEVEQLIARYEALDAWASRMPDAGFNDQDPRWGWWHERPR